MYFFCFFLFSNKKQDREFVEMDVPFNGAPKRPGSPSPLTSPAHSTTSRGGILQMCCGRCYPQRYQVRSRRGILASTGSISESAQQQSKALLQPSSGAEDDVVCCSTSSQSQVPNVSFRVPSSDQEQAGSGSNGSNRERPCSSASCNETRV